MQSIELNLIVAATRNMGIGLHGTMPWQGLRKEMKYFARVTTRVPPQVYIVLTLLAIHRCLITISKRP
jgi:dihydrofolate reductase